MLLVSGYVSVYASLARSFMLQFNFCSFLAPKSKRDTSNAANGSSLHTISVVPSYITLSPYITDIYFQCYVNRLTARYGQTLWVRFGLTVSCNKTERVFACGNVLFIKQLVVDDAGKYRCVLNGSEATFKTVAVFGTKNILVRTIITLADTSTHCMCSSCVPL